MARPADITVPPDLRMRHWLARVALALLAVSVGAGLALSTWQPETEARVVLSILLVLTLGILWWLNRMDGWTVFSAVGLFTLGILVYHVLPLLHFLLLGTDVASFGLPVLVGTMAFTLLGVASFAVGYAWILGTRLARSLPAFGARGWSVPQVLVGVAVVSVVWNAGSLALSTDVLQLPGIQPGYFDRFSMVASLALITLVLYRPGGEPPSAPLKLLAIVAMLLSIAYLLVVTLSLSRRDYIKLILGFGVLWTVLVGRVPWRVFIPANLLVFVLVPVLAVWRGFRDWSVTLERIGAGLKSGMVEQMFLRLADYMPNHENFQYIVAKVPEQTEYLFGASVFKLLTFWIPRALWPEKPLDVPILIVQEPTPMSYATGTSMGTTLIGEFLWNLGIVGVIAGSIAFGVLCRAGTDHLRANATSPWAIVFYAFTLPWIFELFRGGLATIIVSNTVTGIVPLVLLWYLTSRIREPTGQPRPSHSQEQVT